MQAGDGATRTDDELVAGLRAGQPECADALFARYWEPLRRFCGAYLNDPALGEDVAQETLLQLTRGAALPSGALRPWLYRIARNRCLDVLRRWQRSPTRHGPAASQAGAVRHSAGPATRAAQEERAALLREIIGGMPEEYRTVLLLKYIEGLQREEIAQALGISDASVKGRLVRASAYLEEELRKWTTTPPG